MTTHPTDEQAEIEQRKEAALDAGDEGLTAREALAPDLSDSLAEVVAVLREAQIYLSGGSVGEHCQGEECVEKALALLGVKLE